MFKLTFYRKVKLCNIQFKTLNIIVKLFLLNDFEFLCINNYLIIISELVIIYELNEQCKT